jgi:DNA end-binding protein Ku
VANTKSNEKATARTTDGARALWTGAVSFGLVQIPVRMLTAERADELSFHQLDRHDLSPIGYERVNKVTGKKVAWGDIVKGYQLARDEFVVMTDEDFAHANVAATQTIDILDFVGAGEIPPAYFERPYHLVPDGRSAKAYTVLREAMKKKRLVAVAQVVIRTRQHLCAVIPEGDLLELDILRFAHELKAAPTADVAHARATDKELAMAETLIDAMVGPWKPSKYKDTYRDDLLAAIHEKAKRGAVAAHNVPTATRKATTADLLEILRKSVAATKGRGPQKAHPRKARTAKHAAA